jgi:hypothetical protein
VNKISTERERVKRKRKKRKKKEKNGEPKNSTRRDGGLIYSEQDNHLERGRKKKFQVQEQRYFSLSHFGVTPSSAAGCSCRLLA